MLGDDLPVSPFFLFGRVYYFHEKYFHHSAESLSASYFTLQILRKSSVLLLVSTSCSLSCLYFLKDVCIWLLWRLKESRFASCWVTLGAWFSLLLSIHLRKVTQMHINFLNTSVLNIGAHWLVCFHWQWWIPSLGVKMHVATGSVLFLSGIRWLL